MPNHSRSRHPPTLPPAAATVLLVDREALYRWFVAESLRGCGVDVVPCESLDEAADLLRRTAAPNLLIVDGEMVEEGDGDGFRAMRAQAAAVPCLIFDPRGDFSPSRLGAVTVAVKPVDTATLISLVTRQLPAAVPAA